MLTSELIAILPMGFSASLWLGLLLVPWCPWSVRQSLAAVAADAGASLDDVTVVIPARNEGRQIARTLAGLQVQCPVMRVVLVDDRSTDNTVTHLVAAIAFGSLTLAYLPTLRYYALPPALALRLPIVATLYLLMTWSSALRYWCGIKSAWRDRVYLAGG